MEEARIRQELSKAREKEREEKKRVRFLLNPCEPFNYVQMGFFKTFSIHIEHPR